MAVGQESTLAGAGTIQCRLAYLIYTHSGRCGQNLQGKGLKATTPRPLNASWPDCYISLTLAPCYVAWPLPDLAHYAKQGEIAPFLC